MTDTLIARLRLIKGVCDEAADRIEAQDKTIAQLGGIGKNAMEQCFALTKEHDQLRAEIERLQSEREGIIQRSNEIISSLASGAAPQAKQGNAEITGLSG